MKNLLRNFSYTFISNSVSILISTILIVIVPRFISIESYGYWQLYIFFNSYISYMSLGLTDGAYLRYGGYKYDKLPKKLFISQFWFLVLFDIICDFTIAYMYAFSNNNSDKISVVFFTCFSGILVVPRSLLTFILQATNRIKEYAVVTLLERVFYFSLVIIFLLIGITDFDFLILADILGKIVSTLYAILVCKDIVFGKIDYLKNTLREIKLNISAGSKLLFANFASMFIVGVVRYFVEKNWSVRTFGKISLTLSISNMLIMFINALGIVLFPVLRRTSYDNLPDIYKKIRSIITVPLVGILVIYYPVKEILLLWLPQYSDSIIYMAILFPMSLFESKMQLLINTYLKTLRKENLLLKINLITALLSVLLSFLSVFILNNLNLTVISILAILAIRYIISETIVSKILKINFKKDLTIEVGISIIFILCSWFLSTYLAFIIYIIIYMLYLLLKKKEVILIFNIVKDIKF
ncbi:hypothetical protein DXF96_08105 [Heyndrickxia coagulans]|uniref:hypothetical protein n=1 Tax=Heyndrickxia coagulans TaxID=1398 RepID=UPI000D72EBE6|nr:hypothetical protein [Heyndrickxia coagulans]AWP35951.1 hypothetical protein CYJ15_02545 [Heyndrickxia coagulans]QDI61449.1 hypothetical protein DXF96_08105 [Heyndrickxia coagulans]